MRNKLKQLNLQILKQIYLKEQNMNQLMENSSQILNNKSKKQQKNASNTVNYIKLIKEMKLDQDLRRIKHLKQVQKNMKKDKDQITQIEAQLERVEKQIHQRKQQMIKKQLEQIQKNKKQRQQFIQQSNKEIKLIKKKSKQKKKKVEEVIKQINQKQTEKYQKALKQRINRYRNPINFSQIKQHEHQYVKLKTSQQIQKKSFIANQNINKKKSIRVKSQIGSRYQNEFENLSIDHKSLLNQRIKDQMRHVKQKDKQKKIQLIKLISKKNEYGNRVEKQFVLKPRKQKQNNPKSQKLFITSQQNDSQLIKKGKNNIRMKTQSNVQSKRQQQARLFYEKIRLQNESIMKNKKLKLDTNLPKIELKQCTKLYIKKINHSSKINLLQKLQKLKKIQDSYIEKFNSNNPEAIDLLSELTLAKADLFLKV